MVVSLTLSCIEEKQLIEKISHQRFSNARIHWHWILKHTTVKDTRKFTIRFLSSFFRAPSNQEWFDCLDFLWNDIQQKWSESNDFLEIIFQAIEDSELDAMKKDTILSSLLQFSDGRDIIRACYRIAPENGEAEYIALIKMLRYLKSIITISSPIEGRKDSSYQLIFALMDDLPPVESGHFTKKELLEESSIYKNLDRSIQDKYTYFKLLLKCHDTLNKLKMRQNIKNENFQRISDIFSRYDIHTTNPFDGLQFLKDELYSIDIQKEERSTEIQSRIENLEDELKKLYDKFQTTPQKRPFGYVDKPIERFLAYCGDISCEIVLQCIFLYLNRSQNGLSTQNMTLPFWIHEEFDKWWENCRSSIPVYPLSHPTRQSPYLSLSLNNPSRQVQIVIPKQLFPRRDGLDHVDLVLCNNSKIITEERVPLYYENWDVISNEIRLNLPSPSPFYTVDLVEDSINRHWKIEGFNDKILFFDYNSSRLIEKRGVPTKQFILLTKEKISISPESAISEIGQLTGGWKDFSYFIIDPEGEKPPDIRIPNEEEIPTLQHFEFYIDSELFEENIFIDNCKVIVGRSPKLCISFKDPEMLFKMSLSIHPKDQTSLEKPIYYNFEENREILDINERENVCEIDLGKVNLLGENPIGFFTIRIRNEFCKFDTRFECVCIPDLRISYSNELFLPQKNSNNVVTIQLQSRDLIQFEPDSPVTIAKNGNIIVISSNLQYRIQGKLSYHYNDDKDFIASLSILIPQLAWRFENESQGRVWPIQRSVVEISENDYESYSENSTITIFLLESFNGQGILSIFPQNQDVTKNIVNGRGSFPLDRFNDTLRVSKEEITQFLFSMDLPNGKNIHCTLFEIKRWIVQLTSPIKINSSKEGDQTLEIFWKESFQVPNRAIIIWKMGREKDNPSKICEGSINQGEQHLKIRRRLLPGIYYLQFIRKNDGWDSTTIVFPGENTLNTFQFSVEIAREELLHEADEYFEKGEYLEAIRCYRELESQNKELVGIWIQKIMNRLIYPRDIARSIECITEIVEKDSDIKDTDFSFFALIIKQHIINRPYLLDEGLCKKILHLLNSILIPKFDNPKKIICNYLNEVERTFQSIDNMSDDERKKLTIMLDSIKKRCM